MGLQAPRILVDMIFGPNLLAKNQKHHIELTIFKTFDENFELFYEIQSIL